MFDKSLHLFNLSNIKLLFELLDFYKVIKCLHISHHTKVNKCTHIWTDTKTLRPRLFYKDEIKDDRHKSALSELVKGWIHHTYSCSL